MAPRCLSAFLLLGALAPASALAFAPAARLDTAIGPPVRLHIDHTDLQARLSAEHLGWIRFSLEHPGWTVRWDEETGTPLRMYGDGLDFGPVDTAIDAERAAQAALQALRDLIGVDPPSLRLTVNVARGDLRFVTFQRQLAGVPIEGALIQLRFKRGLLVMAGLESHPGADITTLPRLSAGRALATARAGLPSGSRVVDPGRLIILPVRGPEGLGYALTWRSRIDGVGAAPGQWYTYVDAHTGAILHRYDDVRYAWKGSIKGGHEERTVGDAVISASLKDARVKARVASTVTDLNGAFSLTGAGSTTLSTTLEGNFVKTVNKGGINASGSFGATSSGQNDFDWGFATQATASEQDTFWHTHVVRDRGLKITPDLPELQNRMIANVNVNGSCNAFYNGYTINFYSESVECNNTGRIADVVYHEYGHFYHAALVVTGMVDGSIGEGSGDYLAVTITGDPNLAPNFNKDGSGLRNVEPDLVYPDDLVGEVHADGLIWAGAMWDLRKRFVTEEGNEAGIALTDHLFAYTLMSGPTLSTAYEDLILADDDNGDLADGTPHLCTITEELGRHGLGPGVRAAFTHADAPTIAAGVATSLSVNIVSSFTECMELVPSTARLLWSTSPDGPFRTVPMSSSNGGDFTASLPAQPAGTLVYYTFDIQDTNGTTHSANKGRSYALYQTWAGTLSTIHCEDFELNDGGYTHGLDSGDPAEGADDWMWGTPNGGYGDPNAAASGYNVWGNDLGPDGFNGAYQANKVNHLSSVAYSTVGHTGVLLRYRRWLNVEDAISDQATIYVNGRPVWQNESSAEGVAHTEDDRWTWHYVRLNGIADNQDLVTIRWELATDDAVELGGWTIDDVCLLK